MANLHVTEYSKETLESSNDMFQVPTEPNLASQIKVFTTAATIDTPFGNQTKLVCITLSVDGHVAIGASPQIATAADRFLAAGQPYYCKVTPGHVVSAYDGTS